MKGKVLIQPVISEKSLAKASKENVYTFKVDRASNKMQIADAVASEFDVKVLSVRTINVRPRHVRFGKLRRVGMRSAWKKALVTLADGDKIEIFDIK